MKCVCVRLLYLYCFFSTLTALIHNTQSANANASTSIYSTMQNSTIYFLENFLNYTLKPDCDLDYYIKDIYENSFTQDNYLGDFSNCIKNDKNMTYLFFIFIQNTTESNSGNFEEGFAYYFKDLMFHEYYLFSMCVPGCIDFFETQRVNPFNMEADKDKTFFVKFYDAQQIYSKYIAKDIIINSVIFYTYIFFLFLALFFALIPTLDSFKSLWEDILISCRRGCRRRRVSNLIEDQLDKDYSLGVTQNEDLKAILSDSAREENTFNFNSTIKEENPGSTFKTDLTDLNHLNDLNESSNTANTSNTNFIHKTTSYRIYANIASIFSITKNIKRVFKRTNNKNKINSSYINDNSMGFLNGLKAINLFCLTYCTIFWIFIESPNTISDYKIKDRIFTDSNFVFPLIYYLYWSIYLTFAFNGFAFGYKFLNHMSHSQGSSAFNKALSFVLPQFFRYPLYIFLIFVAYNIQYLLNFGMKISEEYPGYGTGPLFYVYKEISNYTLDNLKYFLLLYANFQMKDTKLTTTSIYVFFFVFVNEMQYFFILLLILLIYHLRKNLGLLILFVAYFSSMVLRTIYLTFGDPDNIGDNGDIRDFFGFEIYSFHFFYGLPVYILGVFFGVLYFEYNTLDSSDLNSNDSNLFTDFVKFLASSKKLQFVLILSTASVLIFFVLYDNLILFENVRSIGFTQYKYDMWDKFFSFMELDVLAILIFLLVFTFVIFYNSRLKQLLESNFWIPFSRLYFVIACLLSPIAYFLMLNLEYPINFTYSNVMILTTSLLFQLYMICFFISLLIELPLKVGFKKIMNECFKTKGNRISI